MPRSRKAPSPFGYFCSSPEVLRLVLYGHFHLCLRNVEDLLFEQGIDICKETVRHRSNRFGPPLAADIRAQRISGMRGFRHWRLHYLWHAVPQDGAIFESYVAKPGVETAAPTFVKKHRGAMAQPRRLPLRGHSPIARQ